MEETDQKVWYVCEECGCRVPQSGMTKIKKGPDFVFRCSEHLTRVHHREATCMWVGKDGKQCKEIFEQSRSGYISKFCPAHRKENAVKVALENRRNADLTGRAEKKAKKSKRLYDPKKWNCASREDCLDKHDGYACLPCKGCKKYHLKHGEHDPLENRRTS